MVCEYTGYIYKLLKYHRARFETYLTRKLSVIDIFENENMIECLKYLYLMLIFVQTRQLHAYLDLQQSWAFAVGNFMLNWILIFF